MITFWSCLLERINIVNKKLQGVDIDLGVVVQLYNSLIEYTNSLRNMFNDFLQKAKLKSGIDNFQIIRIHKRKLQADETREGEFILSGEEKFRIETFTAILDRLNCELIKRTAAYTNIFEKFKFFIQLLMFQIRNS